MKLELGVLYRKGQGVQVKVQKEDTCLSDNKNLVPYFLSFSGRPNLLISRASWIVLLYFLVKLGLY